VLRRSSFLVAAAAVVVALVPGTASATPQQAAVDNYQGTQYFGTTQVLLSDGRTADISVMEDRSPRSGLRAFLSVSTFRETPCQWGPGICPTDFGSGFAELSKGQLDFDRSLGGASVTDIPVTIVTYGYGPGGFTQVAETVSVSVVLTGTGRASHTASHSTECPMGGECQSIRVEASRAAIAQVIVGTATASGEGSLFRGHSVDAAAPKVDYSGN
jgi:hypothetical protein